MRKYTYLVALLGTLLIGLAVASCTVYPRTHAGHTSQYGTATVPTRRKENRHF